MFNLIKNRIKFFKDNELNGMREHYKKLRSYSEWKITFLLFKVMFAITTVFIFVSCASKIANNMNDPNNFPVYMFAIPMMIVPIYVYGTFALMLSLVILWGAQKVLFKEKWFLDILSIIWNRIGIGTSGGFLFGLLVIMNSFLSVRDSYNFNIVETVTVCSLAGTFISIPIALVEALGRSAKSIVFPPLGILFIPIIFSSTWTIAGSYKGDNTLHEIYLKSAEYYGAKYANELVNLYSSQNHMEVDQGQRQEVIDKVIQTSQSSPSFIDPNIIFWIIVISIIISILVFIIPEEKPKWMSLKGNNELLENDNK